MIYDIQHHWTSQSFSRHFCVIFAKNPHEKSSDCSKLVRGLRVQYFQVGYLWKNGDSHVYVLKTAIQSCFVHGIWRVRGGEKQTEGRFAIDKFIDMWQLEGNEIEAVNNYTYLTTH